MYTLIRIIKNNSCILSFILFSISQSFVEVEAVPDVDLVAKVVPLVAVPVAAIIKAAVELDRIRVYDSWGCPGATKEIRDVLESPSCCSRTSDFCLPQYQLSPYLFLFNFFSILLRLHYHELLCKFLQERHTTFFCFVAIMCSSLKPEG